LSIKKSLKNLYHFARLSPAKYYPTTFLGNPQKNLI